MYGFGDEATQETKDFFGFNDGTPVFNPDSKGMLDGDKNVLQTACPRTEKATPNFVQRNATDTNNLYLERVLNHLNTIRLNFKDRSAEVDDLEMLPDGAYNIYEASQDRFKYNLQINDNTFIQYHRNNGVTKIGVQNPLSNETSFFFRSIEGQIAAADLVNKAYVSKMFPNTHIFSGVQMMPITPAFDKEIMRVINLMGGGLFPLSL